jgi:hypothetical protein
MTKVSSEEEMLSLMNLQINDTVTRIDVGNMVFKYTGGDTTNILNWENTSCNVGDIIKSINISTNIIPNIKYFVDTTNEPITLTFPSNCNENDNIFIICNRNSWMNNSLTLNYNNESKVIDKNMCMFFLYNNNTWKDNTYYF